MPNSPSIFFSRQMRFLNEPLFLLLLTEVVFCFTVEKSYPSLAHSVKPQYMQHPQSFNSMLSEGFVPKIVNPFSHIGKSLLPALITML